MEYFEKNIKDDIRNFDKSVKLHLAKSANEFFRKIVDATIVY